MSSVPAAEPLVEFLPERAPTQWRPVWFLVSFYAAAFVSGLGEGAGTESIRFQYLSQSFCSVCLAGWAITDSLRRRRPIPLLSWDWYTLTALLLVPCYVIRTRGLLGVGWIVLNLCLALVAVGTGVAIAESQRFTLRF